jgi:hypothetical protein
MSSVLVDLEKIDPHDVIYNDAIYNEVIYDEVQYFVILHACLGRLYYDNNLNGMIYLLSRYDYFRGYKIYNSKILSLFRTVIHHPNNLAIVKLFCERFVMLKSYLIDFLPTINAFSNFEMIHYIYTKYNHLISNDLHEQVLKRCVISKCSDDSIQLLKRERSWQNRKYILWMENNGQMNILLKMPLDVTQIVGHYL